MVIFNSYVKLPEGISSIKILYTNPDCSSYRLLVFQSNIWLALKILKAESWGPAEKWELWGLSIGTLSSFVIQENASYGWGRLQVTFITLPCAALGVWLDQFFQLMYLHGDPAEMTEENE